MRNDSEMQIDSEMRNESETRIDSEMRFTMIQDEIRIDNLEIYAHHGVFAKEKEKGQHFYVNAVLYTDLRKAGQSDDLTASTHYGEVCLLMEKVLTEQSYDLIETAAEKTAEAVLLSFPNVKALDLELRKPEAPIPLPFESVSVKIHRGRTDVYIAFGSNLGDSRKLIEDAIKKLEEKYIRIKKVSSIISTKPYGGVEQPDFLNGVLLAETLYTPTELLDRLHEIEQEAGRERKIHWGPRTLDLDIIFYGREIYEDENLIIPHVDMENRDFVLKPMAEIAPNFRHPVLQKTMKQLLDALYQ